MAVWDAGLMERRDGTVVRVIGTDEYEWLDRGGAPQGEPSKPKDPRRAA